MCIIFYTVYVKFYLIWYRIPFYTFAEHMHTSTCSLYFFIRRYVTLYDDTSHYTRYVTLYDDTSHHTTVRHIIRRYVTLYDDTSHYTTIRHIIRRYVTLYDDTSQYLPGKSTVLKVLCYQNVYGE